MGQPRDVLVGICSQVVLLPIVGFALAGPWPMAPELALGVMLGVLTHQFAKPAARRLRPRAHTLSMVLFVLVLVGRWLRPGRRLFPTLRRPVW